MASSPIAPSVGTLLAGKYRVERVLGAGGMGVVLEATHLDLDQRVAIKTLLPELVGMPDVVERFLREGRAAAKIEGEHVARVLDVIRVEGGSPLLVMEMLDGRDLSFVRARGEPLAIRDAVGFVLQACRALEQAHGLGIVHRDLKPANLFLARRRDGTELVKVLDFGISKMPTTTKGSTSMTRATAVMGSAEYMSPEHMISTRDVDARTDIWALGVVLYELLTAQVPFPGDSVTQVCALVMSKPAPSPRLVRPDIPAALEAIVLRCLEKDREARFDSVEALADALMDVWDAEASAVPSTAVSPGARERMASLPLVAGAVRPGMRRPAAAPPAAEVAPADRPASPTQLLAAEDAMSGARVLIGDEETSAEASAPPTRRASSTTVATTSEPIPEPPVARRSGLAYVLVAGAVALGIAVVFGLRVVGRTDASNHASADEPIRAPVTPDARVEPVAPAPPTPSVAVTPVAETPSASAVVAPEPTAPRATTRGPSQSPQAAPARDKAPAASASAAAPAPPAAAPPPPTPAANPTVPRSGID